MPSIDFGFNFKTGNRDLDHQLRWQSRCVLALYARSFPGLKIKGIKKILIECVPVVVRADVINSLGIFILERQFEHHRYLAADTAERKRIMLETIHQGSLVIAESCSWPTEPFQIAYAAVVEHHYVNEWRWPKPKASPDRMHKTHVLCLHEMDRFYAWIMVFDKRGNQITKTLAFEEAPSEFQFIPKLGKLEWISNEQVTLFDFQGKEVKSVSI